jgi:hypothetical protein
VIREIQSEQRGFVHSEPYEATRKLAGDVILGKIEPTSSISSTPKRGGK